MIKTIGLCAGYSKHGDKKQIFNNLGITFEKGEITVIIGRNGCGKSTLLKAISGRIPIMSGEVLIDGKPLLEYKKPELARTISLLPQSRDMPAITVQRLVLHGRFPYLGYPRRYRKCDYEAAEQALADMGMTGFEQREIAELSGGERQKVYIAMALAQQTPVVMLDEPSAFLDVRHQLEIPQIAKKLKAAGKTVIMVLHDLNTALRCADKLAVLAVLSGIALLTATDGDNDSSSLCAFGNPHEIAKSGILDDVFGVETKILSSEDGEIYYSFGIKKESQHDR